MRRLSAAPDVPYGEARKETPVCVYTYGFRVSKLIGGLGIRDWDGSGGGETSLEISLGIPYRGCWRGCQFGKQKMPSIEDVGLFTVSESEKLDIVVDWDSVAERIPKGVSPLFAVLTRVDTNSRWNLGGRFHEQAKTLYPIGVWWDGVWYLSCLKFVGGLVSQVSFVVGVVPEGQGDATVRVLVSQGNTPWKQALASTGLLTSSDSLTAAQKAGIARNAWRGVSKEDVAPVVESRDPFMSPRRKKW